jgi:hypothetical protein
MSAAPWPGTGDDEHRFVTGGLVARAELTQRGAQAP